MVWLSHPDFILCWYVIVFVIFVSVVCTMNVLKMEFAHSNNLIFLLSHLQVILMLSSDLDPEDNSRDKAALDRLLTIVLYELQLDRKTFGDVSARTPHHEVQLIVMRLLSVFMSRTKSGTKAASEVRWSHSEASKGICQWACFYWTIKIWGNAGWCGVMRGDARWCGVMRVTPRIFPQ